MHALPLLWLGKTQLSQIYLSRKRYEELKQMGD